MGMIEPSTFFIYYKKLVGPNKILEWHNSLSKYWNGSQLKKNKKTPQS
jgi:hypothetical protein